MGRQQAHGGASAGVATRMTDPLPPRVFGWKDISTLLEVSIRTAQEFADRNRDPLPVEHGHRGIWAYVGALHSWARRQNVPYVVHKALRRGGADEPGQGTNGGSSAA